MPKSNRTALALAALVSACAAAPERPTIRQVTTRAPDIRNGAALDLRGLNRISASKGTTALAANVQKIKPGRNTIYFAFGAGKWDPEKCWPKRSFHDRDRQQRLAANRLTAHAAGAPPHTLREMAYSQGMGEAVILGIGIIIKAGCAAAVMAQSNRPRRCYRVTFDAMEAVTYAPRLVKERPVVIDGRNGQTVSTTSTVPCAVVDKPLKAAAAQARLRRIAAGADGNAQYRLYTQAGTPQEKWKWACLSAHNGHRVAQWVVGNFYEKGRAPVRRNLVQAYKWYRIEQANGARSTSLFLNRVAKNMTPTQIARAKQLAARWKPNPRECGQS